MGLQNKLRNQLKLTAEKFARVVYAGVGAILCLHRVIPFEALSVIPDNRSLEITPEDLDALIGLIQDSGFDIIPLEEVPAALRQRRSRRFIAITFDDGYLDNLLYALPVFRARGVPFTVNITTGFIDRTSLAWWNCLEELFNTTDQIRYSDGANEREFVFKNSKDKITAFEAIAGYVRSMDQQLREPFIQSLFSGTGLDPSAITARLMMDWEGVRKLATESFVCIGAHSVTHPTLKLLNPEQLRTELTGAKAKLEAELRRPIDHLAYPFGGVNAVGDREIQAASECGFTTATTTRRANLFPGHAAHLHALPRLSLSGNYPILSRFRSLDSGLIPAIDFRGRRMVL